MNNYYSQSADKRKKISLASFGGFLQNNTIGKIFVKDPIRIEHEYS